jgi:hypothetical protein
MLLLMSRASSLVHLGRHCVDFGRKVHYNSLFRPSGGFRDWIEQLVIIFNWLIYYLCRSCTMKYYIYVLNKLLEDICIILYYATANFVLVLLGYLFSTMHYGTLLFDSQFLLLVSDVLVEVSIIIAVFWDVSVHRGVPLP